MKPLDALAQACERELRGDSDGTGWVFHRCMSHADRLAFDVFLAHTGDQLASEPGTTEYRFRECVRRMVHLQKTGELG